MNDLVQTLVDERSTFAALLARIILGFLFFFQGYDAVFRIGIVKVADTYSDSFADRHVPRFLTLAGALFTSFAELIGGLLLVLGLFRFPAYVLLGTDLMVATFAFGLVQPMWDMKHMFPRLALLLFLIIIPETWDHCSLDHFISKP